MRRSKWLALLSVILVLGLAVTGVLTAKLYAADETAATGAATGAAVETAVETEAAGVADTETPALVSTPVTTEEEEAEPVEKLKFTTKSKEVQLGKSKTFKVNLSGVKWKSSKPKVASVSKNGKITGKKIGTTKITATVGDQKVSINVKVYAIIGIDAGHQSRANLNMEPIGPGSSEKKIKVSGGTSGVSSHIAEYVLTLDIAKALKAELKDRGYKVVLTRNRHDVDISNVERAKKLNKKCNIAIRLHADGSTNSSIKGASALYPGRDNKYVANLSDESKKLSDALMKCYISETGLNNRGLYVRNDLTGTNWSTIPVSLIEMGYMTNSSDDRYMASADGRKAMVKGLADGVDAYYGVSR